MLVARSILRKLLMGGAVLLAVGPWLDRARGQATVPEHFVAVDTSRLLAPTLPFALIDAFPSLRFAGHRPVLQSTSSAI